MKNLPVIAILVLAVVMAACTDQKPATNLKGWSGTNAIASATNVVTTSTVYVVQSGQSCTITNLNPSGLTNYAFFTSGSLISNVNR